MRITNSAISLFHLINRGFNYVIETSNIYKIDESHGLKHSIDVYRYSKKIYNSELINNSYLESQRNIIYMAAIGHDMCDKKYMNEKEGINKYKSYLSNYMTNDELEIMSKIIGTMSYSKVIKNGYPDLGEYQLAYHIVRESDLLASYDIDRAIIYNMYKSNNSYTEALKDTIKLMDNRVLKIRRDNLFITEYSKEESKILHTKAKEDMKILEEILKI